jgi:hypothetical protein
MDRQTPQMHLVATSTATVSVGRPMHVCELESTMKTSATVWSTCTTERARSTVLLPEGPCTSPHRSDRGSPAACERIGEGGSQLVVRKRGFEVCHLGHRGLPCFRVHVVREMGYPATAPGFVADRPTPDCRGYVAKRTV